MPERPTLRRVAVAGASLALLAGCTSASTSSMPWPLLPEQSSGHEQAVVAVQGTSLTLVLADSEAERSRGLGERDQLPDDGMLFVFERADRWGIWMKGMRFALDILWLADGRVVHVERNVQQQPGAADRDLPILQPRVAADAVLELAAGRTAQLGIDVGDAVSLRQLL